MNRAATCLTLLILGVFCAPQWGLGQENVDWLSGDRLDRQAQETAISLDWQAAPLRQRLTDLSTRQRISVFLDRQIDGSQPIKFSASNVSFEQLLWKLADQLNCGVCRIENVYYVGPRSAAAVLPNEVNRLKLVVSASRNRSQKRQWQRSQPLQIQRLSQPRSLVQDVARDARIQVQDLSSIPHDLWAACVIGDCSVASRLSMLAIGFGKTWELDADLTTAKIVDLPARDQISREFKVTGSVKAMAKLVAQHLPELKVQTDRRSIRVFGSAEQVLAVDRLMVSQQKPDVAELSEHRFTIKTADKRGNILNSIAHQLTRKLSYQPAHRAALNARVELELKDATVEELLAKTLDGTGLKFRLTEETLEILD